MMPAETIFKYNCCCGKIDFLVLEQQVARCKYCNITYPVWPTGVILFDQQKTNQNDYFDELYSSGYSHVQETFNEEFGGAFQNSVERAEAHLKLCGIDTTRPLEGLSFLDAACGIGWLSAGLMSGRNISNSKIHAFDISPNGMGMLANFAKTLKSSNRLELSVQDAEELRFDDAAFDVIIGSSMLHHIDNYEDFLKACRRMLKPNGVALFGEPFALGYGLGAAALLLAQEELRTCHQGIIDLYEDISIRVKSQRENLKSRVDKHLFFQSKFIPMAQQIGFNSVEFVSSVPREYYRDSFVTKELLFERGIKDARLSKKANEIYKVIYDIFDADDFAHSIASFLYIVLRP